MLIVPVQVAAVRSRTIISEWDAERICLYSAGKHRLLKCSKESFEAKRCTITARLLQTISYSNIKKSIIYT